MKEIRLEFDFGFGPISGFYRDMKKSRDYTGIDVVDRDELLWELNDKLQEMYTNCYDFNVYDRPFVFIKANADPNVMMDLLRQLKARLNELNDGSFVIVDGATPELEEWDEMPDISW